MSGRQSKAPSQWPTSHPPAGSGATTPRHDTNALGTSNREQRTGSLLDVSSKLANLKRASSKASNLLPSSQEDHGVATVEEHLQSAGAKMFAKLERRMMDFDRELRDFSHAARQLGSSVGILSSAYHLRKRVAEVLYLFHENAADLFPNKVQHQDISAQMNNQPLKTKQNRSNPPRHVKTPVITADLNPEGFPEQMFQFARDITTFLECVNEFPEFTDETVNACILVLQGDLGYWASSLRQYSGQFRSPPVQQYLHDLSLDLSEHIESVTCALSLFVKVGVPTIKFAQEHSTSNLLNLSTIATLFSSVTITSLQFSYNVTNTASANAVNAFWFASLVFSIAAAVNSILGLTWKQAIYRSPHHLVPWWVSMWIKRSPLIFLVLSIACFSAGLVTFAYSSHQHPVTSTITTVFSAFSSFGLTAVFAWFVFEHMVFYQHEGRKWLGEIIDDLTKKIGGAPGYGRVKNLLEKLGTALAWSPRIVRHALIPLGRMIATFGRSSVNIGRVDTIEPTPEPAIRIQLDNEARHSSEASGHHSNPFPAVSPTPEPGTEVLTPLARFRNLARRAVMMNRLARAGDGTMAGVLKSGQEPTEAFPRPGSSRVACLVPKLRNMAPTQDVLAHRALVKHMQFSPDGKFLATSSWDRTSVIFRVGERLTPHQTLSCTTGFVGQVAWSPCGNFIITKLPRAIKIWTPNGECRNTIERGRQVQTVTWLPQGEAFLSVEGSSIAHLDINGTLLDTYDFERMSLHAVAVTSDHKRIFTVGRMVESPDGLQPCRSSNENQIIAFNLERKEIESRIPVFCEVRDVAVSQSNRFILVSYKDKAPQLWQAELVNKPTKSATPHPEKIARLRLRHTFIPKITVDFTGPSYFGGKDDEMIVCAGKTGDIHIWDRESGALLHHVPAQLVGGNLTCMAWNPAAEPFTFATGSHDGSVRVWTTVDRSSRLSPLRISEPDTPHSPGGAGRISRPRSPLLYSTDNENGLGLTRVESVGIANFAG